MHLIRTDVVGLPVLNQVASQRLTAVQSLKQITRRVTLGAVARPLNQIGTAVPLLGLICLRFKALVIQKQHIPEKHAPALVERKRQCVFRRRLVDRVQTR